MTNLDDTVDKIKTSFPSRHNSDFNSDNYTIGTIDFVESYLHEPDIVIINDEDDDTRTKVQAPYDSDFVIIVDTVKNFKTNVKIETNLIDLTVDKIQTRSTCSVLTSVDHTVDIIDPTGSVLGKPDIIMIEDEINDIKANVQAPCESDSAGKRLLANISNKVFHTKENNDSELSKSFLFEHDLRNVKSVKNLSVKLLLKFFD
jgi:hypothetical protein